MLSETILDKSVGALLLWMAELQLWVTLKGLRINMRTSTEIYCGETETLLVTEAGEAAEAGEVAEDRLESIHSARRKERRVQQGADREEANKFESAVLSFQAAVTLIQL